MLEQYVVFTGRPNAGKSSLIRELMGLDLRTGKRAGTTRRILKYPLSRGLQLVDMPGFGRMMGASKRLEAKINRRIIRFVEANATQVALAVHVLDIASFLEVTRRLEQKGFISVDVEMVQLLATTIGEFPLVAANKIDKADADEVNDNLRVFLRQVSCGDASLIASWVFPVSAKTGDGLSALKTAMHTRLVAKGYRTPFTLR